MQPRPLIMGVVNVTPDSFSGSHYRREDAIAHASQLIAEGADILDIGGESTRPGSAPVPLEEELDRVIPVIREIRRRSPIRLSVDTTKYEVAVRAVEAGAEILNDISAGSDVRMVALAAGSGVDLVLMHMQGTPQVMQLNPNYPNGVVAEISAFLRERVRVCREMGVAFEKLWVDPGIGFGKTLQHNLQILNRLDAFKGIGGRLVIGTSRKAFTARLTGDPNLPIPLRESGTIASNLWALQKGASVFRVHSVGELKRALQMWEAIRDASE